MNNTTKSRIILPLPPVYSFQTINDDVSSFVLLVLAGVVISSLSKFVHMSHQIPAILSGIAIGTVTANITAITIYQLNSSLLLSIFVPILIAKLTYTSDNYLIVKSLPQILIIAILGNIFFIPTFAMLIRILQGAETPFVNLLIIAIVLTPNDCPIIPDLDGIKNLETLMRGESTLSIVLCLTIYTICLGVYESLIVTWYQVICVFLRYIGIAIPVGYMFGWITSLCIRQLYNDSQSAICTVFSVSYFTYNFCEHVLYCSGSLAASITLYCITLQRTRLLTKTDNDIVLTINIVYTFIQVLFFVIYITFIVDRYSPQFRIYDFIEASAIYIIGNVLRLILFLLLSPILSRIGYGFDFTSLVTIFWAVHKGPLQLIQVVAMHEQKLKVFIQQNLLVYNLLFVLFTYSINGTTLTLFLKRFGLIKLSGRRKSNISGGINKMNSVGNRVLTMLKLNRFYSDANWPVIHAQTELKNPYSDYALSRSAMANESAVCTFCNTIIHLEPSREEYNENLKDVTMRALKAQRVSFVKQHETGYLSKLDTRTLLQAIEVAIDSTDMNMKLDNLFECINNNKRVILMKTMKKVLIIDSSLKIPKSGFRKKCYYISSSLYFELILHTVTLVDVIIVILRIAENFDNTVEIAFTIIDAVCVALFLLELQLKLLSFLHVTYKADFKLYLKNYWNKIDFFIIFLSLPYIIASILTNSHILTNKDVCYYLNWIKLLTCLKLLKVISRTYPFLVAYVERKKDFRLMRAFVLALGIVVSCEEVIDILPTLTDQSNIREVIKVKLLKIRSDITQKLGVLEKERPSLTTTIKSTQALRSVLKFLREGIEDLKSSGLIDNFENQKLLTSLNEKQRFLDNLKVLELVQPQVIFNEIPWLCTDEFLLEYVYMHVKTKIFNAGDILCKQGDIPDGVYIVVAGFFKVTYYPTGDEMERLKQNGELPIKEFLEYLRFDEVHEDYLSSGNRMGELAFLTNRPYCCSIVSEAPSQAFIIPRDILQDAMTQSPDPAKGLGAQLWRTCLIKLGRRILLTTPTYQSASTEQLNFALNRAIVPDTSYYSIIYLSQVVEDVLLLEGIAVDFNTREIFTAPCAIPRHVTKLIMPRSTLITVRNIVTKLMFFPIISLSEYEMMLIIEQNSELVPGHGCTMLTEIDKSTKKKQPTHIFGLRKQTVGASYYTSNKSGSSKALALEHSHTSSYIN